MGRDYKSLVNEFGEGEAKEMMSAEPRPTEADRTVSLPKWRYTPSNSSLSEVNSYKSQLEGEKLGLYTLSNENRTEILARIDSYQRKYERNLEYEKNNNLNPDGSKKE